MKWEADLNLVAEFLVDPHFVGEVEVTAATGATRFRNESYGDRRCCALVRSGGDKCSPDFSQCGLSLFC